MKKLLLALAGLAGLLAVAFGVVLAVAASKPMDKTLERSVVVQAPPAAVFARVHDLGAWDTWSPWLAMDPSMEVTYGEPRVGPGASYSWSSESMGQGTLTLVSSEPDRAITTAIDFGEQGTGAGAWAFTPEGDGVRVTWRFTSHGRHLRDQFFHLVFLEPMLGPQLEEGLERLRAVSEG